ncbi:MAG: 16S rRNA processing protein RimM [Aquidulcibacter sp.]|nr:16S rRNA processing protein RimM [Aquidulcibacter sp.]
MALLARLSPSVPILAKSFVLVGAIAGAFGVRGEIRLRSFTADPEAIVDYAPFCNEKGQVILSVQSWRPIKDGIVVTSKEVPTREAAMALRNTKLFVPRDRLPEAEEDEFYHVDLIGLRLEALDGADLGRVRAVIPGPQDLLEIEATPGAKGSWFLPFTKALVPIVDLPGRKLVGDVPIGLIPVIGEVLEEPPEQPSRPKSSKKPLKGPSS